MSLSVQLGYLSKTYIDPAFKELSLNLRFEDLERKISFLAIRVCDCVSSFPHQTVGDHMFLLCARQIPQSQR